MTTESTAHISKIWPVRLGLITAGIAFIAYPALRPYSSESGLAGAAAFASPLWLIAHALGMLGFVALAWTWRAASTRQPWAWSGRSLREVETRGWLAVGFLLPYYGAEAYGLNELGRFALTHGQPDVLAVANA